jgi:predicted house-cleaning noncanonical NTP pyrophosphatase (MazG superfamily)
MKIYNKLVRDKTLLVIGEQGKVFSAHTADEKEFRKKLNEKLLEEVNEFIEEPCLEELADVMEVLAEVLDVMEYSIEDLDTCMTDKAERRGAFKSRVILESVEE